MLILPEIFDPRGDTTELILGTKYGATDSKARLPSDEIMYKTFIVSYPLRRLWIVQTGGKQTGSTV